MNDQVGQSLETVFLVLLVVGRSLQRYCQDGKLCHHFVSHSLKEAYL